MPKKSLQDKLDQLFDGLELPSDYEVSRETANIKNSIKHQGISNNFYGKQHDTVTKQHLSVVAKSRDKDHYCKHCKKYYTSQAYNEHHGDYCSKNPNRIIKSRKKKDLSGPQDILTCPHCKYTGGQGNFKRYHFDNCIFKGKVAVSYKDGKKVKTYATIQSIIDDGMLWSKVKKAIDYQCNAYKMQWKMIKK